MTNNNLIETYKASRLTLADMINTSVDTTSNEFKAAQLEYYKWRAHIASRGIHMASVYDFVCRV